MNIPAPPRDLGTPKTVHDPLGYVQEPTRSNLAAAVDSILTEAIGTGTPNEPRVLARIIDLHIRENERGQIMETLTGANLAPSPTDDALQWTVRESVNHLLQFASIA